MLKNTLGVGVAMVLFSACAGLTSAHQLEDCSRSEAYEKGFNDARANRVMDSSFSKGCKDDQRTGVADGYRVGYEKALGLSGHSATRPLAQTPAPIAPPSERAFFCKTTVFGELYEAFGATEFETRKKVLEACTKKHVEFHCDEIKCQRNE